MRWVEVKVKTTQEASEIVSNILYESGADSLVIEDPSVMADLERNHETWDYIDEKIMNFEFDGIIIKGYLEETANIGETIENIKNRLKEISSFGIENDFAEISTSEIEDEDWSKEWKKFYKPQKIGKKVVVKPSWEEYAPKSKEVVVEIDPGMSFGTGTHETTILCVKQLEKYVKKDSFVIDVGSGTGILAIVAAKLGAQKIVAVDLDEECVESTKQNALKNKVRGKIEVVHGNLLDLVDDMQADVIVANIFADIIAILAPDVRPLLEDGGIFIASGIIQEKEEFVKKHLKESGLEIIDTIKMGEWVCIVSKKVELVHA